MSHRPLTCDHVFSAWTTYMRTNEAGEQVFAFQRRCYVCPHVEEETGAIIETREPFHYARLLEAGQEPDD